MFALFINVIISYFYRIFGVTELRDWKHYPNYAITLDDDIPTTGLLSAYDVQPDILIQESASGAILGYDAGAGAIDETDFMGHVTLEGTIIVWGDDDDVGGMPCVIFPYNTQINHITADTYDLEITPIPVASPTFTNGNVKWRYTDRPNYWFMDNPRISITVKYDTSDNPYVDTTYWAVSVTRYDSKKQMPVYYSYGTEIPTYKGQPSSTITNSEYRSQIDLCAWLIGILKRKYTQETAKLNSFRKSTFNG